MANKVLTMVRWGEVVVAEADLSSWDDTNFTLNWTTNDANAYVIHFIAIGGSDVSARVVDWTMRTTTGNTTVTGVGFQPDVVFHAHGGHTFTAAAAREHGRRCVRPRRHGLRRRPVGVRQLDRGRPRARATRSAAS